MVTEWSAEELSKRTSKEVRTILENALRKERFDVASMCETVLEGRLRAGRDHTQVAEFHFVCQNDRGVTLHSDGTFSTRAWVVSEVHRIPSIKNKAILALHESKSEPSYRQGTIIGWSDVPRGEFGEGVGVEFLVTPTDQPLQWQGLGSGEKGYLWLEQVAKR
jgi:hypothetical protein